jgi:hypothetical protein
VTIWFGANDGTISPVNVPLPAFKANLRLFIETFLSDGIGATRVLLVTPPPINVHRYGSRYAPLVLRAKPPPPPPRATDAEVAAVWAAWTAGNPPPWAYAADGVPADDDGEDDEDEADDGTDAAAIRNCQHELGPRVYARKMAYAAAVLDVVRELADPRVRTCNVWMAVIQRGLLAAERAQLPNAETFLDRPWEAMVRWRLPGSGLPLAEEFEEGLFTDRLHFGDFVRVS